MKITPSGKPFTKQYVQYDSDFHKNICVSIHRVKNGRQKTQILFSLSLSVGILE